MSDKFLGTRSSNLTNGTANLYINQLTIENLDPSLPVKTNANKSLISQKLEISDVNNLQNILNSSITNPLNSNLNFFEYSAVNMNNLSLVKVEGQTPAPIGELKIYASALTSEIHMVDDMGNDTIVGGDVFDQSLNKNDSVEFNNLTFNGVINKKLSVDERMQYSVSNGAIFFTQYYEPLFSPPTILQVMSVNTNGSSFINTPELFLTSINLEGNITLSTQSKFIQFLHPNFTDGIRIINNYSFPDQNLKFQNYIGNAVSDIFTINKDLIISEKPILSSGKITTPELAIGTILSGKYNLPTVAGTPGQYLTMGAGTSTSWQTPYTFTGGTITGNLTVQGITTLGLGGTSFQFPNTRGTARQILVDMLGNGVLTYQSMPTILEPSFGVTYFNGNITPTLQPVINTFYDINGIFLTPGTINTRFIVGGTYNGGLRYTGLIPRVFKSDFSGSWYTGGVQAETYEIGLHVNGNIIQSGKILAKVDNSAIYPNCFAGSTLINLSINDILELKVRCITSTQSIIINTINFNVVAIGV